MRVRTLSQLPLVLILPILSLPLASVATGLPVTLPGLTTILCLTILALNLRWIPRLVIQADLALILILTFCIFAAGSAVLRGAQTPDLQELAVFLCLLFSYIHGRALASTWDLEWTFRLLITFTLVYFLTYPLLFGLWNEAGDLNTPGGRSGTFFCVVMLGYALYLHLVRPRPLSALPILLLSGISLVTISRTASACSLLFLVAATSVHQGRIRLARFATIIVVLAASSYAAYTYIPAFASRLSGGDQSGSFMGLSINTEGRRDVWVYITDNLGSDIAFGHGTGASRDLLRQTHLSHPHNDYLKIVYDHGLLGCFCYFGFFALQFLRGLRGLFSAPIGTRHGAFSAVMVLSSLSAAAYFATDNAATYAFVIIPLGILLGLASEQTAAVPLRQKPATRSSLPSIASNP